MDSNRSARRSSCTQAACRTACIILAVTIIAAMMYGPGRMAFGWQPELALLTAGKLVLWTLVAVVVLVWTWRRALRRLDVNGG